MIATLTLAATSLVAGAESGGNYPLTLAFAGDTMMGITYPTARLPQNDGRNLFSGVAQANGGERGAMSGREE